MNEPSTNSHEIDDEIHSWIVEAGDPDVDPRPEHVEQVRGLLLDRLGAERRHQQSAPKLKMARWLLAACALFATALGIFALPIQRVNAWAQVAEALQKRPWVHSKTFGSDGKQVLEAWFSTNQEVLGHRFPPWVEFHDVKRGRFTKYVPAEGTVYHLPPPLERSSEELALYQQLLDPKGPAKFLFGMEVVGQARREVEEGGKKWLEVELTLRVAGGSRGGPAVMRIRIDPDTKLPRSWVMVAEDGKSYRTVVDYPDIGPTDVYDLGAPRTAKLVNLIPSDDVGRVLDGLKVGRNRFDDYSAIVLNVVLKPAYQFPKLRVSRYWRKGRRWRVDELRPGKINWPPPANADGVWWKAHQGEYEFVPSAICDGHKYWFYYLEDDWKPNLAVTASSVVGPSKITGPADDPWMPWWLFPMPERVGHPNIVDAARENEVELELKPDDGPPGTARLRLKKPRGSAPRMPPLYELWIKPGEDYLSMRTDVSVSDSSDTTKVAYTLSYIMETVARSPQGFAYPTRVRQRSSDGRRETLTSFYLDFDAKIQDDLFVPIKGGR